MLKCNPWDMPSNFCFHVLGWNLSVYRWKWQCFFLDLPHHHSTPGANICTDNIEFSFFPAMFFPETYIFWRKDCFFALVPICYLFRNQIKKTLSKVVPLTLLWFCRNFASNSIFAAGMFYFSRDDYPCISTFICPCLIWCLYSCSGSVDFSVLSAGIRVWEINWDHF